MLYNTRYFIQTVLIINALLIPLPARAVVILEDLQQYWTEEIEKNAPVYQLNWFEINTTATTANTVTLIAQQAGAADTTPPLTFTIRPLPNGLEALLPIRLAKLNYYLNMDKAFQNRLLTENITPLPTTEQQALLQQHRAQANIEQFFIHNLYEHSATAPDRRCVQWQKQQELVTVIPSDLTSLTTDLSTLYQQVHEQFQANTQSSALACTLVPLHTQAQVREWIKNAVDNKLVALFTAEMSKNNKLMSEANKKFIDFERRLEAAVKNLPTTAVFELERQVANVESNFGLIADDKMQLIPLLARLEATEDLQNLRELVIESQALLDDSQAVLDGIDAPFLRLLAALEQIPTSMGHCQFRQSLQQHCQGLNALLTQGDAVGFMQRFGTCMTTTHEFIAYLQSHPQERVDLPAFPQLGGTTQTQNNPVGGLDKLGPYNAVMLNIMQGLATIPEQMSYCNLWSELQDCRGLRERYLAITTTTPSTKADFITASTQCITNTKTLLDTLTQPTTQDKLRNVFGTQLKQLSDAVATQISKRKGP